MKREMKRDPGRVLGTLVVCAGLLVGWAMPDTAEAYSIRLSQVSSDETPASALDAVLDFERVDRDLQLTVHNLSDYSIQRVYFEAPSYLDLELQAGTGWVQREDASAGGLGTFDYAIYAPLTGPSSLLIAPGETQTFVFDVSFVPFASTDTHMQQAIVAAKFVRGPGDDSAFGASGKYGAAVPLPGAVWMGLVLLGGLAVRRARAS